MERLTVIGSGTMGHSIALSAAWAGMQVKMYGTDQQDIDRGLSGIKNKIKVLRDSDLINEAAVEEILSRIESGRNLDEAIEGASFIIETIPEDLHLKKTLFLELDKKCHPDVILASNTSGLSISQISEGVLNPGRILITHFWNPAHLIPLVEVLRTSVTADQYFERAIAMLNVMGKKAIEVKKEVPGLVGNRLQFALLREAQYLLEQGIASREDIDSAVTFGIGRRLSVTGPLISADMGGLDVFESVSDYLFKDLSNARYSSGIKQLVGENNLGTKSGQGYYTWGEDQSFALNKRREVELIRLLREDKKQNDFKNSHKSI